MFIRNFVIPLVLFGGVSWFVLEYTLTNTEDFDPVAMIKKKKIIITGASSGIGRELAVQLCQMGADIFITARRNQQLQKVINECVKVGEPGGNYGYLSADMSDLDSVDAVIHKGIADLGGLDYLFLNHAYIDPTATMFTYQQYEIGKLKKVFDVNFFSYVALLSAAMPHLRQSGGRVAVTSSVLGRRGDMLSSKYAATKHAMEGFFKSLDLENYFLGTNVSITIIVPGFISNTDGVTFATMAKTHETLGIDWDSKFATGLMNELADGHGCATEMIRSTARREVESYYPKDYGVWGSVLKSHLFPHWLRSAFRQCRLSTETDRSI